LKKTKSIQWSGKGLEIYKKEEGKEKPFIEREGGEPRENPGEGHDVEGQNRAQTVERDGAEEENGSNGGRDVPTAMRKRETAKKYPQKWEKSPSR